METFGPGVGLDLDIQKTLQLKTEDLEYDLDLALKNAESRLAFMAATDRPAWARCLGELHWLSLKKGDQKRSVHYFDIGRRAALEAQDHALLARLDMNQVLFDWPDARLCLPRLQEALESFNQAYRPEDFWWQKGKADCLAQLSALHIQENRHALAIDLIFQWARHKEKFHLT